MHTQTKTTLRLWTATLALFATASCAFAVTQGTFGNTSTGVVDLDISVSASVRISGLSDMDLGTWSGDGDMSGSQTVCAFASPGVDYTITFDGGNQPGNYVLENGMGSEIQFDLYYAPNNTGSGYQLTTPTNALVGQTGASDSTDCLSGETGSIQVVVSEAALASMPSGTYSETISVTLAPDI